MAKKIFLVLGNGFNEHFGMHMSYAAYHEYRKQKYDNVYHCIEVHSKDSTGKEDAFIRFAKKYSKYFTVWDFYFIWPLHVDLPFDEQDVNFELYYYDSFDSGFWAAVVDFLKSKRMCDDEQLSKIALTTFHAFGDNEKEKIELMKRKIKFFAKFLKHKYKNIVNKCMRTSDEDNAYSELYRCIYSELEKFEKQFADFLKYAQSTATKMPNQESQQSFIQRIKDIIDPDQKFELQIINFNFNMLDDDVTFPCEYVHDTIEKPIFSGTWTNSTERDDLSSKEIRYKYIFDKMYRRRSHNLKLYKDIIRNDDENIIAFYGTSLSFFDISEITLILDHRSKEYPIYLFYTTYNDTSNFAFNFIYDCYSNFFSQYFKFKSINQFYSLIEDGIVSISEIN